MSATLKTNAPRPGSWRAWLLDTAPESRTQARLGAWFRGWLALRRNPLAMTGLVIVVLLLLLAAIAPLLAAPAAATDQDLQARLLPASAEHWFGTDELGATSSRASSGDRASP